MSLKSRECPRQKINREDGKVEWVVGMFFLLLLSILLCAQLEVAMYQTASSYLEDALAASNLASAVVDLEEYGISHTVRIPDADAAYDRYRQALKGNLGLNDAWEGNPDGVIAGKVTVQEYIIYNVCEEEVFVSCVNDTGEKSTYQGRLGSVRAPNGQLVENTSVYSAITFPVEGMFGIKVQARKDKLVDVVSDIEDDIV